MDYQEAIEWIEKYSIPNCKTCGFKDTENCDKDYCACESKVLRKAISAMQELQIYKDNDKRNLSRTDRLMDECTYRHENGNCLKVGGFCTSVPLSHCQRYKDWYADYRGYKQLGTLEELKQLKETQFTGVELAQIACGLAQIEEYKKLGTLEEVREAVERQQAKKPIAGADIMVGRDDDGNPIWETDYVCAECGMGIAPEYVCCPYCRQDIDWSEEE